VNVYFIKSKDAVKIGISNNIRRRMIALQHENAEKIELLHFLETNSYTDAFWCEACLHAHFEKYHIHGEWFKLTQEILKFIELIKTGKFYSKSFSYKKIIKSLRLKIIQELSLQNINFIKQIKRDLILLFPNRRSGDRSLAEIIKEWIADRNTKFTTKEISINFNLTTRREKKNIATILLRLNKENQIQKLGRGKYIKNPASALNEKGK